MEFQAIDVKRQLMFRRCTDIVVWLLLVQSLVAWVTGVLQGLNGTWPRSWIDSLEDTFSINLWLYFLLSYVAVIAFVSFHIRYCTVIPEAKLRRRDILYHLFLHPKNLVSILGLAVLGGVTARWYLGLANDKSIRSLTAVIRRRPCFCDTHFFVVMFGSFVSLLFAFNYFIQDRNLLKFSVIQQSRFMQVKAVLAQLLLATFSTVLKQLVCFYVPFLLLGWYLRPMITELLSISKSCSEPLDSLAGMLSIRLLWTTFVVTFALRATWDGCIYLTNLMLTEICSFPLSPGSKMDVTMPLHVAMAATNVPYLQYLAYLDFCLFSQSSKVRRHLLFSLSRPGGHPHNWKRIINECLALLHQLTDYLSSAGEPMKLASGDKGSAPREESEEAKLLKYLVGNPAIQNHEEEHPYLILQPSRRISPALIIKRWTVRRMKLMNKTIKLWFTGLIRRHSEAKQCLFLGCQPHIWATEGLSFVVVASLTEDKFGVVQPDLPEIITVLCDLQQCLEKQDKWLPPRSAIGLTSRLDANLKTGMSAAVKTALYRIATKFKEHLSSLPIPPDYHRILQQYASYSK